MMRNILTLLLLFSPPLISKSLTQTDTFASAGEAEEPPEDPLFEKLFYSIRNDPRRQKTNTNKLLTNGRTIPLIGLGVGNLPHNLIPSVLDGGLSRRDLGYVLIDTAHSSYNEEIISKSIQDLLEKEATVEKLGNRGTVPNFDQPIHVITKVWYTHLGYERTILSVKESLEALHKHTEHNIRTHILLHWPRCYDEVEWMNCEEEEDKLPQNVKDAGPSPLLDRKQAFLASWKALEDIYVSDERIESIGVSNFEIEDMQLLIARCKIVPHIYQGSAWTLFSNPDLIALLNRFAIMFQSFQFTASIAAKMEGGEFPEAKGYLEKMATHITSDAELDWELDVSTLMLAWIVQKGTGVVCRSSSALHMMLNSPSRVAEIPLLNEFNEDLEKLSGYVMKETHAEGKELVKTSFENKLEHGIDIFFVDKETGERKKVMENVVAGDKQVLLSHPGHVFVAAKVDGEDLREFRISAKYGEEENFSIEPEL